MAVLRLTPGRRRVLVETLRELANMAAGALVLGQFVGPQSSSPWLIVGGVATWVTLVALATLLVGEKQHD